MNKDIKNIIQSFSSMIQAKSNTSIASYFYHIPISKEESTSIEKYADYTIEEIIHFLRIERMFDLNIINIDEKEELYKNYIEYQKLRKFLISQFIKNMQIVEHEVEKNDEDQLIKERYNFLEEKLMSYGVLVNFDYEKAILNQVDKEVKIKLLKK